jgi:hypothetical protein
VRASWHQSVQRERTTWKLGKLSGAARYFRTGFFMNLERSPGFTNTPPESPSTTKRRE